MKEVRFIIAQNSDGKANLSACCTSQGFYLNLRCLDGAWAMSQIFPWHDIAEAIYRSDPDMFGILDEPLHFIFPQTMERLGYNVPSRRIREVRQKLGYCWKEAREIEELHNWIIHEEGKGSRD
jgi:hypothetical protein